MNSSSAFRVLAGPGVTFLHETMFPSVSWLGPAGISAHAPAPFRRGTRFSEPICAAKLQAMLAIVHIQTCPRFVPPFPWKKHAVYSKSNGSHNSVTEATTTLLNNACKAPNMHQVHGKTWPRIFGPLMYIHIHDIGMLVISLQKTIDGQFQRY